MLSTGCRVSEVAHLRMENIDFRTGECTVLGKGNKERTVYISDNAMYYLQRYLAERSWNASSPLFLNKEGQGCQSVASSIWSARLEEELV